MFKPVSLSAALALMVSLLAPASAVADNAEPVLHYGGQSYQGDQLPASIRVELHKLAEEHHQQLQQVMDNYAVNRYVQELAEQQGKPFAQLQQQLLSVTPPTNQQIEAFYNANKARIPGTLAQVRGEIANYLNNQKMLTKQRQLLAKIGQEQGYRVELPALPQLRLAINTEGYPRKGNPEAPVTLVEFADYQCPHCKDAGPVVKKLLEKYGDKVQLVFRDFPINQSGISRQVAEAAVCAEQQGTYWPFHQLAFERQSYLKSITPLMLAEELGLDTAALKQCLETGKAQAKVAASKAEGRELGVTSTPSFFVNGRPLPHSHGDLGVELSALIDQELESK